MRRILKAAALVAVGALAVAAYSWARSADTGQVQACTTGPGNPILLGNADGSCPSGVALAWSVRGPTGPAGPQGKAGAAGSAGKPGLAGKQGPTGPAALAQLTPVTKKVAGTVTSGGTTAVDALCPAGQVALSGGYRTDGAVKTIRVTRNGPFFTGAKATGWSAAATAAKKQSAWSITAIVICTKAS